MRLSPRLMCGTLVLCGCAEAPTTTPPPPPAGHLELRKIASGDQQMQLEGTALSQRLEVVVSRGGASEHGARVIWHASAGTLTASESYTTISGLAHTRLTLAGQPGAATITARLADHPDVPAVTFEATALERLELHVAPETDGQHGEFGNALATPLRVRVTRQGIARSGVTVGWSTSYGAVEPISPVTDADGIAEARWTLGTVPRIGIEARATTPGNLPATFRATAASGGPFSLEVVGQFDVPANFYEARPRVRLRDRFGNVAIGTPVEWVVVSGPATIRSADSVADAGGYTMASIDPTGTAAVIELGVRTLVDDALHTFEIVATPPRPSVSFFTNNGLGQGFRSLTNLSHPANDTILPGMPMTWTLGEGAQGNDARVVQSIGWPSFAGGTIRQDEPLTVYFTLPGDYRYRDAATGATGTLVVSDGRLPAIEHLLFHSSAVPANSYEAFASVMVTNEYDRPLADIPIEWEVLSGPATIRRSDALTQDWGGATASFDPTGAVGEVVIRVRSPLHQWEQQFTFRATAPDFTIELVENEWCCDLSFWSHRNHTSPVVDTVAVGTTVTWRWGLPEWGPQPNAYTLEAVGSPSFTGGIIRNTTPHPVLFTVPGTYRYRIVGMPDIGTLVVQ